MPREVVALVSADDAVAAVRVHADRVHDLLRRSGCGPAESIEVTESYAFALLDALVNAPETVVDMAGWWFGRALELGRRLGDAAAEEPGGETATSVLAGTTGEAQVRAALAGLPETERAAVMLRDGYDLPAQAVAVALHREEVAATGLIGIGRLHLLARYDDRRAPDLTAHSGRSPADLATLTALADGALPPARAVPLRRHLSSCPACEEVVEALAKARRLTAALPILAMPDDAREAMLDRVAIRAASVLPSVEEVLAAVDADEETRPAIAPIAIVLLVVLALVLGIAVAVLTRSGTGGSPASLVNPTLSAAPVQPSFSVSAPAPSASASATTRPSATATATATARRTPTAPATSARPVAPAIVLSPAQGPRGTTITVTGSGWTSGDVVTVVYSGPISQSRQTVQVGSDGTFTAQLTANGLVPGDYAVQATGGSGSASATFRQTS